jgi:hypothetical protein
MELNHLYHVVKFRHHIFIMMLRCLWTFKKLMSAAVAMTRVGHREVGHSLHIYLHSMSDSRDVARKEQGPCDEVTYKNVGYVTI